MRMRVSYNVHQTINGKDTLQQFYHLPDRNGADYDIFSSCYFSCCCSLLRLNQLYLKLYSQTSSPTIPITTFHPWCCSVFHRSKTAQDVASQSKWYSVCMRGKIIRFHCGVNWLNQHVLGPQQLHYWNVVFTRKCGIDYRTCRQHILVCTRTVYRRAKKSLWPFDERKSLTFFLRFWSFVALVRCRTSSTW